MNIEEKLQKLVNEESARVEEKGRSHIETCDASYYGWDSDVWDHRHSIMQAFIKRGYHVSSQINHGVLDIVIVKHVKIE